ncbi:hypothetical protein SUNI508_09850 [Seiridium unicorne]|uniref:Transferase n=1 Tax=Seiridium unicorne TaxID=138068 RepID=A0ABR2UN69_9PEZI
MARKDFLQLRPLGYETQPEVEEFPLSTLDHLSVCTYNHYAFVFKLDVSTNRAAIASVLQRGLEATLGQCRHMVGTIEKNEAEDYSIIKKRSSTVPFVVKWLDGPDTKSKSFEEMEKLHFNGEAFGDKASLGIEGMTYGAACDINDSPIVSGFQLNFIPGGMILCVHHHHYMFDVKGTESFVRQLAANCNSVMNDSAPPSWDDEFMNRSRFTTPMVPFEERVDPPPIPQRHPDHLPCLQLISHLSKSKAAELKCLASPTDGSWISTYDAMVALWWRISIQTRVAFYPKTDTSGPALFNEAIDMRKRVDPKLPEKFQGNALNISKSMQQEKQLTLADIISNDVPLSRVASHIRAITNAGTPEPFFEMLNAVAKVRNKASLFFRLDSFAPMCFNVTEWRDARMCEADFGFGRPVVYRHLMNQGFVSENIIVIYPPRVVEDNPDEGVEFFIPFEEHDTNRLLHHPDVVKYFDYRGLQ